MSLLFISKPINPEFVPLGTFSHTKPVFSLPYIILGPDTRQLKTTSIAQSLLELFKIHHPELFTLLSLDFPMGTPIRQWPTLSTLAPVFYLLTTGHSMWHAVTLSRSCEYNKLLPTKSCSHLLQWRH